MKKVLLAGIKHETNTFASMKTGLNEFKARQWLVENEIINKLSNTKSECGGIIDAAQQEGFEIVPVVMADAQPSGCVTRAAFDKIVTMITDKLKEIPCDGVLLVLHGAMVLEDEDDGEGALLLEIRKVIGQDIPIMATLDLHCHFSDTMQNNANGFFGYDTYPHIDLYERGFEAATNMGRVLRNEIKPIVKYKRLPICGMAYDTSQEPMASLLKRVWELEQEKNVISVSLMQGFKQGDVAINGMSIVVVTNNDEAVAQRILDTLAQEILPCHLEFIRELTPLKQAVETAIAATEFPVILADVSDNPGAGSPGDGTQLLEELIHQQAKNTLVVMITDAESVERVCSAGVGNFVDLELGGKMEDPRLHGNPLKIQGLVRTITDGKFINKGKMNQGLEIDVGRLVVVAVGGIEIMIAERRHQPYDAEIVRRVGITPEDKNIIAIKSITHFRATFGAFAKQIIDVDLPGVGAMNPLLLPYTKLVRPISPLDKI